MQRGGENTGLRALSPRSPQKLLRGELSPCSAGGGASFPCFHWLSLLQGLSPFLGSLSLSLSGPAPEGCLSLRALLVFRTQVSTCRDRWSLLEVLPPIFSTWFLPATSQALCGSQAQGPVPLTGDQQALGTSVLRCGRDSGKQFCAGTCRMTGRNVENSLAWKMKAEDTKHRDKHLAGSGGCRSCIPHAFVVHGKLEGNPLTRSSE